MPTSTPTLAQLERALTIAQKIKELEDELQVVLSGDGVGMKVAVSTSIGSTPAKRGPGRPPKSASVATEPVKRGRKPFSAESRAKMAAAQRARWAKKTGTTSYEKAMDRLSTVPSKPAKKGKRTMSPEVRARLAAAMKARWAAAKKKGLPGPNARK